MMLFGTAGIPICTKGDTIKGVKKVRELGLDCMELEFVRRVNITKQKAPLVKQAAKNNNIKLSCHGQYYINLNAKEKEKITQSKKRILNAADIANRCGAFSITFHMAYYMKDKKEAVYKKVKKNLKDIVKKLNQQNNKIWLRPEVGGKTSQFGGVDELIKLSNDVEQVLPCIDFAHVFARSNGKINSYNGFRTILEKLEKGLGKRVIKNMHCHIEGIAYSEKGEKNHLNLNQSKFNYKAVLKVLKEFNAKGVVICESPSIEKDALILKKIYKRL